MSMCVAMETTSEKGYENVTFETACKTIVKEMNNKDNNTHKSTVGETIQKMKRYMKSFK